MKRWMHFLWMAGCTLRLACGDAGVLVPEGRQEPDAAIFSLDEMTIAIRIDNGDARVEIRQIFGSHTDRAPSFPGFEKRDPLLVVTRAQASLPVCLPDLLIDHAP